MSAPPKIVDLHLEFTNRSFNVAAEGSTLHYAGGAQWPGADTLSPAAFRDSTDHARCPSKVRAYHDFHLSKGWYGLAYSETVCPHGTIYRGRGKGVRSSGQGTNEGNLRSYAILYIAGGDEPLTNEAKSAIDYAARVLLGAHLRWVHSDWKATACPGSVGRAWRDSGWTVPVVTGTAPGPTPPTVQPERPPTTQEIDVARLPTLSLHAGYASKGKGDQWPYVRNMQGLLIAHGNDIDVDGFFGPGTEKTLRDWQGRTKVLAADGVCGPKTWAWLIGV